MQLIPISPNQNEVITAHARILFSYQTPVAASVDGKWFRTAQKWSKTTSKHINAWIAGRTAETKPQEFFADLYEK